MTISAGKRLKNRNKRKDLSTMSLRTALCGRSPPLSMSLTIRNLKI